MAAPLYAVYRRRFGFSAVELTLIFAIYAIVLIPSLLVFGQLSDRLGRRRMIAARAGRRSGQPGAVRLRSGNRLAVRRPGGAGARG